MSVWGLMEAVPAVSAPLIPLGTLAVQMNEAPLVEEFSVTAAVVTPEQMVWLGREKVTAGVGLIVTG